MKTKKLFLMATMLLMCICSFAQNSNTPLKGDVNGDGKVDVADIVAILKIMKDAGVTQYTVTYHSNGGNSTPAPQTVNAGQTITLASAISRNADSSYTYTFAGWNTNSNGTGTNYNAGASYTVNGNINLYAKWNRTAITPVTPTTEYYWYVGQTDPSTMSSISPIVTSYNDGGGWYELGATVPETITQLVKGGDSTKYWYVAVPITSGTTLKPVASDMTTLDTSVSTQSIKSFNGISYQIYWYGGATASRNTFRFAKK